MLNLFNYDIWTILHTPLLILWVPATSHQLRYWVMLSTNAWTNEKKSPSVFAWTGILILDPMVLTHFINQETTPLGTIRDILNKQQYFHIIGLRCQTEIDEQSDQYLGNKFNNTFMTKSYLWKRENKQIYSLSNSSLIL